MVSETTTKDTQRGTIRYEAVLSSDPKSKHLALRLEKFSFVEMGGIDLKDPSAQEGLQQALALASAIPTLVISREGKLLDVSGMDEFFFDYSHNEKSASYTLTNFSVGRDFGPWGVKLWTRNALDEEYFVRGFFFGDRPPDFSAERLEGGSTGLYL